MSFILLPTGTLHKKCKKKRLKNFPAGYVGRFYRKLADNIDHDFLGSDFYGRTANDADIPSADVQKYILATSDFTKGIQTDIMWQKIELTVRTLGKSLIQQVRIL